MLMTDGLEDEERSEVIKVPVRGVPVYTFAFGDECDHEVLSVVAKNSKGGTFTAVPNLDDLSIAFSTSLAGLLNVCIEDLTLTVAPLNMSKLDKVNAGNYPQKKGTVMEPITVTFSSLYDRETRKALAILTLPKVGKRFGVQIFSVELKYRVNGKKKIDSDERFINITCTDKATHAERSEVLAEEKRLGTTCSITEARILADAKNLVEAKKKFVDAGKSLTKIDAGKAKKAFAAALMASHASQNLDKTSLI